MHKLVTCVLGSVPTHIYEEAVATIFKILQQVFGNICETIDNIVVRNAETGIFLSAQSETNKCL